MSSTIFSANEVQLQFGVSLKHLVSFSTFLCGLLFVWVFFSVSSLILVFDTMWFH